MKNFYTNTEKFLPTFLLFLLWSLTSLGLLGCGAMPWQTRTVVTYQSIGVTLESAKPALQAMCLDGTFSTDECMDARQAYNQAVTVYKAMGDAAVIAVDTGDDTQYRNLALQLSKLLVVINSFLVTQ